MKPNCAKIVILTALTLCAALCTTDNAFAQPQYTPGERVQVLWQGKWESGTVMPMAKLDLDKSGRVLRVKLDCLADFLQPEGTEIMAKDVRGGGAQPAVAAGDAIGQDAGTRTAAGGNTGGGGSFQPGDRVSAMWNGKRVTGVVVPFAKLDLDKTGRVLRIKIDGMADFLQPEGTEIMARDVQTSNAPSPAAAPQNGNAGAPDGAAAGAPNAPPAAPPQTKRNTDTKTPAMNGAVPNIVGTAWKMLYDQAVNVVPVIRFTKKGTYDTVRYGLGAGMRGNYRQNGSTLFLNNEAYTMKFDAGTNILLLSGHGPTLKLLYNGVTTD